MSTPTPVVPSKAKTWVAVAGGLLAAGVPLVLSLIQYLPPQWAAVITAVIAMLTALGVYQAPYTPPGTTLVPDSQVPPISPKPPTADGGYQNPWHDV